jgi:hypothetical protein
MSKHKLPIHLYAEQMREIKRRAEVIDFFLQKAAMRCISQPQLNRFAFSSGKSLN